MLPVLNKPELNFNLMKRSLGLLLCGVFSVLPLHAQVGRPGMGSPPPGPGLSGSTAKLFGDNSAFSANLEMQTTSGAESMRMPGKMFFDQGKSRFEMDLTQLKGSKMSPETAAQIKGIGMDKTIMISRPDKKMGYQVYPGMQAYIESPLPVQETAAGQASDFKLELTELGKETVDGHPCIKNKAIVTDKDGNKQESLVWNATDLKNFPVKIEHNEDSTKVTMLFHDVNLSKPAADAFDPPADATKYDSMQAMMQQLLMKRLGGGRLPQGQ
jgi:hypothetical protein